MQWSSLIALALYTGNVSAGMLRFSCAQLVTERLDPLVNPGLNPSPHMHQIVGGNAFNTSMDTTGKLPDQASCTTCTFTQDFSNYWTAVLYFRASNGTYKRVPQIGNQLLETAAGGMTVYYISPENKTANVTAFAQGFRMLAGNATQRTQGEPYVSVFRCYKAPNFTPNPPGHVATDTNTLPNEYCGGGIRVQTFFPTCWNGVDLDSPDHMSHMSYPEGGLQLPVVVNQTHPCPASHPVRVPQIFIETIWNTGALPQDLWPTDGTQPLVFSQGDPTGFGHHADYVFAWKGDSLQKAMDARCNYDCDLLTTQTQEEANKCTQNQIAQEDLDDWITELPGGMPVTY